MAGGRPEDDPADSPGRAGGERPGRRRADDGGGTRRSDARSAAARVRGGTMTLGFDLSAMRRLADPEGAFADAREWAAYVGVVSEAPGAATEYARRHSFRQDFFAEERDRRGSLAFLRERFPTERHVFVGTDQRHRAAATATGWEYLDVEEAAAKAGWELVAEPDDGEPGGDGPLARLRRWLFGEG